MTCVATGDAAAQDLVPVQGKAIAYRVSLPTGDWQIRRNDEEMLVVGTSGAGIFVSALDMLTAQEPLPIPEDFHRRILTDRYMRSDSLLMARVTAALAANGDLQQDGQVREIRTLGGERAAYMGARWVRNGDSGWAHAYVTVKDGVMYVLLFVVQGTDPDRHKDLFDRVHDSFVLAETPK